MQHRFFSGIIPQKYNEQLRYATAHDCISSAESIPDELLLSRAHFRFDSDCKVQNTKLYLQTVEKDSHIPSLLGNRSLNMRAPSSHIQ